jgi:hypothetical protein
MTSRSQSIGRGGKDDEETPRRNGKAKKEKEIFAPPLIADLPTAWDEAHESFAVLEKCVYESKRMGASKEQDEMMVCDCVYNRSKLSPSARLKIGSDGSAEGGGTDRGEMRSSELLAGRG